LQRKIREGRRNVGALKLSNLLQPHRFEEDLAISRIRLQPQPKASQPTGPLPLIDEQQRQRTLAMLRQLHQSLNQSVPPPSAQIS
jgi:hypothetical protein